MKIRNEKLLPRALALAALLASLATWAGQATLTVTTTADSGPGSLRQAILDASPRRCNDRVQYSRRGRADHRTAVAAALYHADSDHGRLYPARRQPEYPRQCGQRSPPYRAERWQPQCAPLWAAVRGQRLHCARVGGQPVCWRGTLDSDFG